jgi:hypothetical protein
MAAAAFSALSSPRVFVEDTMTNAFPNARRNTRRHDLD